MNSTAAPACSNSACGTPDPYAIGALAGLTGDRTSLGFVAETERQVVEHLEIALGPPAGGR